MKKQLNIILLTVLLDVIGLGIVLPILPFIVDGYGFSEFYVGLIFSVFSLGMFFGGLIFGKLSDKIGRNKTLELTIFLNIIGYLIFAFSLNIWVFILARFIGGLGASGMSVGQAYISDISNDENRIKNMGLIGAMFGVGFVIGPVFGGFLSDFGESYSVIGFFAAFISVLNLLLVMFFLPKIKKNKLENLEKKIEEKFYNKSLFKQKNIVILFIASFVTAFGFSGMQSTFPLILSDRFLLDVKNIGYLFGFIGIIAILYQSLLIKHVKNFLKDYQMIIFGLLFLSFSFTLFAFNDVYYLIYFIIFMFPIGYGTILPSISGMQSKLGGNNVGNILGINTSMISLGNIFGPFLAGSFYLIWSGLPYLFSSFCFLIAIFIIFINRKIYF